MLTLTPDAMRAHIGLQTGLIHRYVDDLSDAESCLAPAGGNSTNWVVGHLIATRDDVIEMLGGKHAQTKEFHAMYNGGSVAIGPLSPHTPLPELLRMLDAQAPLYAAAVHAMTAEQFAKQVPRRDGSLTTLGQRFFFYAFFHEATHLGQFEYGRHAAGKHEGLI